MMKEVAGKRLLSSSSFSKRSLEQVGCVFTGGVVGFTFTRILSILIIGLLFGGALLALTTFSLKVWRHGKSSLTFIPAQSALALALLWKNFQTYSLVTS